MRGPRECWGDYHPFLGLALQLLELYTYLYCTLAVTGMPHRYDQFENTLRSKETVIQGKIADRQTSALMSANHKATKLKLLSPAPANASSLMVRKEAINAVFQLLAIPQF